jgi:hypothetical protein
MIREYREWRASEPLMTSALAQAGRRLDARQQKKLALWLRRFANGANADYR